VESLSCEVISTGEPIRAPQSSGSRPLIILRLCSSWHRFANQTPCFDPGVSTPARSAHAYVRGNTIKFYEWLNCLKIGAVPEGPPFWSCGDCHVGNFGPVADAKGRRDCCNAVVFSNQTESQVARRLADSATTSSRVHQTIAE
jgi:Uncharacterized protein conserved in bacteria (DUF2252)